MALRQSQLFLFKWFGRLSSQSQYFWLLCLRIVCSHCTNGERRMSRETRYYFYRASRVLILWPRMLLLLGQAEIVPGRSHYHCYWLLLGVLYSNYYFACLCLSYGLGFCFLGMAVCLGHYSLGYNAQAYGNYKIFCRCLLFFLLRSRSSCCFWVP